MNDRVARGRRTSFYVGELMGALLGMLFVYSLYTQSGWILWLVTVAFGIWAFCSSLLLTLHWLIYVLEIKGES